MSFICLLACLIHGKWRHLLQSWGIEFDIISSSTLWVTVTNSIFPIFSLCGPFMDSLNDQKTGIFLQSYSISFRIMETIINNKWINKRYHIVNTKHISSPIMFKITQIVNVSTQMMIALMPPPRTLLLLSSAQSS